MCLNESELIRLVAGELSPDQRRRCVQHLEACQSCRRRVEAQRQTWEMLGAWAGDVPAGEFAVDPNPPAGRIERSDRLMISRQWRLAAAVLLAVGAGVAAGVAMPTSSTQLAAPNVSADEIADALGLESIAQSSSALEQLFIPASEPADAEEAL